jgi:hypothetical protein
MPDVKIIIGSIYGAHSRQGLVELTVVNGDTIAIQMDLDKAREVHGMLGGAIEAAISDQMIMEFLRSRVGLTDETAARALLDFRELRQGTREISWPQ